MCFQPPFSTAWQAPGALAAARRVALLSLFLTASAGTWGPARAQSGGEPAATATVDASHVPPGPPAASAPGEPVAGEVAGAPGAPTSDAASDAVLAPEPAPRPHPALANGDELFVGALLITGWGVEFWDWFTEDFRFVDEQGFSERSSTGGADKTAHFLLGVFSADFLAWRLRERGYAPDEAALWGSLGSFALLTWLEIGDATSRFGASFEDLAADFLGALASYALNRVPALDAMIDFRLRYFPTEEFIESGDASADYSGMAHLMALRLSGVPLIQRTPLRFVEAHVGFYTRGFRTFDDEADQADPRRVLYLGVGLDLSELIEPVVPRVVSAFFEYYQAPFVQVEVAKRELH